MQGDSIDSLLMEGLKTQAISLLGRLVVLILPLIVAVIRELKLSHMINDVKLIEYNQEIVQSLFPLWGQGLGMRLYTTLLAR